jgi:release factor glutamine methyltransferase
VEKPSFSSAQTIGALLREAAVVLHDSGSSRLDAEVLLAHVLGVNRTGLLVRLRDQCTSEEVRAFSELVSRRAQGEPVAYIVGEREFYGMQFRVNPAVLIPRPESELLIDEALRCVGDRTSLSVLDLGTGSGCLSVVLAKKLRSAGVGAAILAVDSSEDALVVAAQNAKRHGVEGAIEFVKSDWYSAIDSTSGRFDLIVANPPYVDVTEPLQNDLLFEPSQALFSEDGGLRDTMRIVEGAEKFLNPSGVMLCEVGADKTERLSELLKKYHDSFEVSFLGNAEDLDRFLVVRLQRR